MQGRHAVLVLLATPTGWVGGWLGYLGQAAAGAHGSTTIRSFPHHGICYCCLTLVDSALLLWRATSAHLRHNV